MAFCFLGLETEGVLELEDGGYLLLEDACPVTGGGSMAFGHIPDWWNQWAKNEERKIRMRKSTKERLAELVAKEFGTLGVKDD